MIRALLFAAYEVLFVTVAACSMGHQQPSQALSASVSLCQVMSHPEGYVGQLVTLQVRIKTFRHGASIMDAACSKYSVSLTSDPGQTESLTKFNRFVAEHRQSSNPLFATVEGRLAKGGDDGFLAKRDFVFRLESARDMHEGNPTSAR
jgi:hypothetical protein